MILKKNRKLSAEVIQADKDALVALEKVADYRPAAIELSVDNLRQVARNMDASHSARVQSRSAFRSLNDDAKAAEIEFHNLMIRVRKHVLAQFGEDSNEAQALGLKKQSERKTTVRHQNAVETAS